MLGIPAVGGNGFVCPVSDARIFVSNWEKRYRCRGITPRTEAAETLVQLG